MSETDSPPPAADAPPDRPARGTPVELREVTAKNVNELLRLKVADDQQDLVGSTAVSIAQFHYTEGAWMRGIYAGDVPVGFALMYFGPESEHPWVWRFLIDARYQGLGFGGAALPKLIEVARAHPGATELRLSHNPREGAAGPFYEALGFTYTGEVEDGEPVMRIAL